MPHLTGKKRFIWLRELRLQHRSARTRRPSEGGHLHQRGFRGRPQLRVPSRLSAAPGKGRGEAAEGRDRPAAVRGRGARQDGGQAVREGKDSSLPVRANI